MFKNLSIIFLMAILPSSALEYGFSLSGSAYTGHGKITENFDIPDLSGFELSLWGKQQRLIQSFLILFLLFLANWEEKKNILIKILA